MCWVVASHTTQGFHERHVLRRGNIGGEVLADVPNSRYTATVLRRGGWVYAGEFTSLAEAKLHVEAMVALES